jgi:Na+/melibiose symporter-like transporter
MLGLVTVMVYIPYQNLRYGALLLLVHLITNLIAGVSATYSNGVDNFQARLSPSSQERTRIMSIAPMFNGLLRSLFGILFPVFADQFGGQLNIRSWKWIVPVYGLICLVGGLMEAKAKERIVQKENHVARVPLRKAIKEVFGNKYLWISNISACFNIVGEVQVMIVTWLMLYGTRMQWMTGIMVNLFKILASPAGNLIAPVFAKRFSNRQLTIGFRVVCSLMTAGLLLAMFVPSGWKNAELIQILIVMIFSSLFIFSAYAHSVISRTITPDIWDYQQWKGGERMESSNSLFGYITAPLTMALGAILPFLSKQIGLVGDWDILYDSAIRNHVFLLYIILAIFGNFLPMIPFFFYDLSKEKMATIQADLHERAAAAAIVPELREGEI